MALIRSSWVSRSKRSLQILAIPLALLVFADDARAATIFVGSWTNTTFGSTGAASFTVDVSGTDITLTVDLDGMVFGVGDPPALALTGTISGDTATLAAVDDPTFGDVSGTLDLATGAIEGLMTGLPVTFIDRVVLSGTASATAISLDYIVCFTSACATDGIDRAVGVIDASVIPLPATAWLFAAGLAGAGVRLRRRTPPRH